MTNTKFGQGGKNDFEHWIASKTTSFMRILLEMVGEWMRIVEAQMTGGDQG